MHACSSTAILVVLIQPLRPCATLAPPTPHLIIRARATPTHGPKHREGERKLSPPSNKYKNHNTQAKGDKQTTEEKRHKQQPCPAARHAVALPLPPVGRARAVALLVGRARPQQRDRGEAAGLGAPSPTVVRAVGVARAPAASAAACPGRPLLATPNCLSTRCRTS